MLHRLRNFGHERLVAQKVEQLIADVAFEEKVELAITNDEISGSIVVDWSRQWRLLHF